MGETADLVTVQSDHEVYIGAMGSERAARRRDDLVAARGTPIDRIAWPFGFLPSARNPRSLAVSVLADVLAKSDLDFARR